MLSCSSLPNLQLVNRRNGASTLGLRAQPDPLSCIVDWWLTQCREFAQWRDAEEHDMSDESVECWEVWHDVDHKVTTEVHSEDESLSYNMAKNELVDKHT